MRKVFLVSTTLFWIAVAGFWSAPLWLPENSEPMAADRSYSLSDVAAHGHEEDCWMAIDGVVYDFTAYLPRHPAAPSVMLEWCGREASKAYNTKNRGRPHSSHADALLPDFRIGRLEAR